MFDIHYAETWYIKHIHVKIQSFETSELSVLCVAKLDRMCVQRETLAASEHKSWSPFISWNFSLAVLAAISCMNVNLFCSVSDNPCFCFNMIPFHYSSANSIDILFHHAAQYHRSRCLQRGSAKGGNLNLDGATWVLTRGCPMGNLNISGVVKAWTKLGHHLFR